MTTLGRITRALSHVDASLLTRRILADPPARVEVPGDDYSASHWIGDGMYARRVVPELVDMAELVRRTAAAVTGQEVLASPWPRSAVSVKLYGPGDHHAQHLDSNSLTALLVLCGERPGSRTVVEGHPIELYPGALFIFDGKHLHHGVPPLPAGAPVRITVPFNLYLPGEVDRPDDQDQLVYGA